MSSISQFILGIVSIDKDAAITSEAIGHYSKIGFFDTNLLADTGRWEHFGPDQAYKDLVQENNFRILVAVDSPALKKILIHKYYGFSHLDTVIAVNASVSSCVCIGLGSLIQAGATLFPDVAIGSVCKLHHGVTLHHDVKVGDYCTIAPGARLLGGVHVGSCSYIGSNATILQNVQIGNNAVIGAGAVVIDNVPPNVTVVGVPARIVRLNDC